MTSLDAGFTFYLQKSPIKPTFGYQHQYFFGKSPEGKTQLYQNGFALAGLAFFKRKPGTRIDRKPATQAGQFTVGYLVHRRGDYYEPNTWRITGGLNLTPNVKVEPEVYFNGLFKNLSPGLRLSVGF